MFPRVPSSVPGHSQLAEVMGLVGLGPKAVKTTGPTLSERTGYEYRCHLITDLERPYGLYFLAG